MNISPLSAALNFGKSAVATCTVKKADDEKHKNATLYEMDPHNVEDIDDVMRSKHTSSIKFNFKRSITHKNNSKFYVLKQDSTGEVISCAETSRHYSQDERHEGAYTLIRGIEGNKHYINPLSPMVAYIANKAEKGYDKRVVAMDGEYVSEAELKSENFSKTKDGVWMLPEKRYETVAKIADKKNNLEYLV